MAYKYLFLSGTTYIAMSQSPIALLWLLIRKRSILPKMFGKRALAKMIKAKIAPDSSMRIIKLPFEGTWCRSVMGGVKVFDMGRGSVFRLYAPGTDKESIQKEVALCLSVAEQNLAPLIKNWNIEEGWYEEEFLEGPSGYKVIPKKASDIPIDQYFSLVEPVLVKMIMVGHPEPVPAQSYLERLESSLWLNEGAADDETVLDTHVFMQETLKRCRNLITGRTMTVYQTFCHGDFHQRNIFWTKHAVKLIDWEVAQRLSLLFDFYNFFVSQIYLQNTSAHWGSEVQKGLEILRSRLADQSPQIVENLIECAELYRLIYYIERIRTFLGAFGWDGFRIRKWIDAFVVFEENAASRL